MSNAVHPNVQRVLPDLAAHFGYKLLHLNKAPQLSMYRQDVSVHGYFTFEWPTPPEPTDEVVRSWLEQRGVMFTPHPNPLNTTNPWYLLAPIVPVIVTDAFHATPRRNAELILQDGLKRGSKVEGRFTSDNRLDCEGYIFVSNKLGTPADAGVTGSYSAYWWKDHKSNNNKDQDTDWVILRINFEGLQNVLSYQDIFSEKGIIIRGIEVIPKERIELVKEFE